MTKKLYALKICPWCKQTPRFYMFFGFKRKVEETWLPEIKCDSIDCKVKPKSMYVPIRKLQRSNVRIIESKIDQCVNNWNNDNPMNSHEGFELDFEQIVKEYLSLLQ